MIPSITISKLQDILKIHPIPDGRNNELECAVWNQWKDQYDVIIIQFDDDERFSIRRSDDILIELPESEAIATVNKIYGDSERSKKQEHLERAKHAKNPNGSFTGFTTIKNAPDSKAIEKLWESQNISRDALLNLIVRKEQEVMPRIESYGGDTQKMNWHIAECWAELNILLRESHAQGLMKNRIILKRLSEEHSQSLAEKKREAKQAALRAKQAKESKEKNKGKVVVRKKETMKIPAWAITLNKQQMTAIRTMGWDINDEAFCKAKFEAFGI